MNAIQMHRWLERGSTVALLAGATIAQAVAATSALQPAAPSPLQQAQPAFGATAERGDASAATKRPEPLGLKPAPGLGLKVQPAPAPASAAAKGALSTGSNVSKSAKNLFDMEDRAIIIVSGKQTTAGELKRQLHAEFAAKNGPPKTVNGGARKLDLAALNATASAKARLLLTKQSPTQAYTALAATPAGMTIDKAGTYSSQKCLDKGPPVIDEIKGTLKAGSQVALWGRCFGDRPGRVEIIGQFPGGKLQAGFASWDKGAVTIAIPGNISGAADHVVAVSVITADGKVSPAMQAKFVAARERIDVPDRLWSPDSQLARASTSDGGAPNPAGFGVLPMRLRVNPQCALDNMEVTATFGAVRSIRGWAMGPANEASVTVDWTGVCDRKETKVKTDYVIRTSVDYSYEWACRVALQARAWAYCPVGIAP